MAPFGFQDTEDDLEKWRQQRAALDALALPDAPASNTLADDEPSSPSAPSPELLKLADPWQPRPDRPVSARPEVADPWAPDARAVSQLASYAPPAADKQSQSPDFDADAMHHLANYRLSGNGGDVHQDIGGGGSSSDSGSGLGDFGRTAGLALASFLDLGLNRGRNTGQLLGAMVAGPDEDKALDRALRRAQIDHLRNPTAGMDPMQLELRRQNYELQRERLGLGKTREGRLTDAEKRKTSPLTDEQKKDYVAAGLSQEMVDTMTQEDRKRFDPLVRKYIEQTGPIRDSTVALAGDKAAATANAQLPAAKARMKYGAQLAPGTAAAVAEARLPTDIEKMDHSAALAGERAAAGAAARAKAKEDAAKTNVDADEFADIETLHPWFQSNGEAGKRQWRRMSGNRTLTSRRDDDMKTADRAMSASADMSELLSKWNPALYTDPAYEAEISKAYELYRKEHQGIIKKIAGMNGGTEAEREGIEAELPTKWDPRAMGQMRGIERFLKSQTNAMVQRMGGGVRGVLEVEPEPARADKPTPEAPARGAAPQASAEGPQSIGTRNGKPVREIRYVNNRKTGQSGRKIIYMDGSVEVVPNG
jgi:hypothetical protein